MVSPFGPISQVCFKHKSFDEFQISPTALFTVFPSILTVQFDPSRIENGNTMYKMNIYITEIVIHAISVGKRIKMITFHIYAYT